MAELNAAAPRITRPPVRGLRGALRGRAGAPRRGRRPVSRRAGPGPRAGLLHPHGVRVLRRRPRGPAAGAGRRWPLRRAGGAAGRQADARDRVRAGAGPRGAGAGGAGGGVDGAPTTGRSPSSWARTRTTPWRGCGSRPRLRAAGLRVARGPCAPQAGTPAGGRRQGRRALRGHPGGRARRTGRSRSGTCWPGPSGPSRWATSRGSWPGPRRATGTADASRGGRAMRVLALVAAGAPRPAGLLGRQPPGRR